MIEIAGYHRSIDPTLWKFVESLALSSLPDLYAACPPATSMLHSLFKAQMTLELRSYFHPDGSSGASTAWVFVAKDDGKPVGFALCLPHPGQPTLCTLVHAAVSQGHKGLGIFKQLLAIVHMGFETVTLACNPRMVSAFERRDYEVLGSDGPSVLMSNKTVSIFPRASTRGLSLLDERWKAAYLRLVDQHGAETVGRAYEAYEALLMTEKQATRNFVSHKMAVRLPRTGT